VRLYLKKRGAVWWAFGGRDFRKSTGHTDERKAQVVLNRWQRELDDPTHYRANKATVASAAERFMSELHAAGTNPSTIRFYEVKVRHVVAGLGHVKLNDLDHAKVLRYTQEREKAGAHPHTVHRELTALRRTLKSAARANEFGRDWKGVLPEYSSRYEPRKEWLTAEEVWNVIGSLDPKRGAAVAFILATASDFSPAFMARREDVKAKSVMVWGTKTATRKREVPRVSMFDPFLRYAVEHGDGEGGLLLSPWTNMPRDLRRACRRAGVTEVTARSLRRSAATWLVKAAVPFSVAAKFLGHASTAMLMKVYGQLDAADVGRLIESHAVQPVSGSHADKSDKKDGAE
jgi:integrase